MTAPERRAEVLGALDEMRAKLDAKIAAAARDLVGSVEAESGRGAEVKITVARDALRDLRASIGAWEAFSETVGAES